MADTETVTIPRAKYEAMVKSVAVLRALSEAGVDNWEGYSFAMDLLGEPDEDED